MIKAKDLRIPFPKDKRQPVYHDLVFALPERSDSTDFLFQGWHSYFGNDKPLYIEYCSGNGDWIYHKAKENPAYNFLAVEMRIDRARKIWAKCKNGALPNLIVAWAEGLMLTRQYIKASSVKGIYVNFPDPWPKRKHAKNRLLGDAFTKEIARILEPNGSAIIVTDDECYSESIISTFSKATGFQCALPSPFFKDPPDDYGTSYFNELFRNQLKPIRFHRFEKI